jgi:4-hydroxy-tetrahydrodipicolinate reductase
MGQIIAAAMASQSDITLSTLVDVRLPEFLFGSRHAVSLDEVDEGTIDVIVDFSTVETARQTATWAAARGIPTIIGTTGFTDADFAQWRGDFENGHLLVAANFAIGAVLAQRFAVEAAKYFERVEIIEYHHDRKVDAPSGTALETAKKIAAARTTSGLAPMSEPTTREPSVGSRGAEVDGIRIHAVRMPAMTAHQEVIFGGVGEGLTLRHDAYDRSSFAAGVILAVRHIRRFPGLTVGLDPLL